MTLLNVVLGALAIAFGVQVVVARLELGEILGLVPLIQILAGGAAVVLGILWMMSCTQILKEVARLRKKYRIVEKPLSAIVLTELIIQMVSIYRTNIGTVRLMILAGTLCGGCLFAIGLATGVEIFGIYSGGIAITLNNLLVIPSMALTLCIALAILLSTWYFSRFAGVWNRRLQEIEESEHALKTTLGLIEK